MLKFFWKMTQTSYRLSKFMQIKCDLNIASLTNLFDIGLVGLTNMKYNTKQMKIYVIFPSAKAKSKIRSLFLTPLTPTSPLTI